MSDRIRVALDIEVDRKVWAEIYLADNTDDAKLASDVEDYVSNMVKQSAAAQDGAILNVELVSDGVPRRN